MTTNNEKNNILKKKEKIEILSTSTKATFVVIILLFFLTFYLIWAWIWNWFLEKIISPLYILLIISLNLFVFFTSQKIFFEKKIFSYIITTIFLAFSIYILLPLI